MSKKLVSIFCFIGVLLSSQTAKSQYKLDFGVHLGGANYLGEIGGKEQEARAFLADMKLNQTRSAIGGFVRYRVASNISVKGNFIWGRIRGADALSPNVNRAARNLSFITDIYELSVQGEYNFYTINDVGGYGTHRLDFRAYAFAGFAGFYYNPKTEYEGAMVDLRPLMTEGVAYSPFSFGIPAGLGCFYTIQRKYRIGIELGGRKTFTDYMDDISTKYASDETLGNDPQRIGIANRNDELTNTEGMPDYRNYLEGGVRGNPKNKDSYFFSTITASKVIRGKSNFYKSKYNFITGAKKKRRKVRAKF